MVFTKSETCCETFENSKLLIYFQSRVKKGLNIILGNSLIAFASCNLIYYSVARFVAIAMG